MKSATSSPFDEDVLAERLAKLNGSQQSIETLSHWCIFHRKKAKQVVEAWEKQFKSVTKDQKIPFLYLANDILQNSKRKGGEFVNEFWKVLPRSLKYVYEHGEGNGKKAVTRLIDIWDERKVFGSRGRGLKDDILGAAPPTLDNNGKTSNPTSTSSSNPIKVVRKDANTIRLKLAVGGMPEKIVTAYQSVLDEHFDEDTSLNKCKTAVSLLEKMDKDVNDACSNGNQQGPSLISDLEEQETILKQCIRQLESVDSTRKVLLDQLTEALKEQEAKRELVHILLQAARAGSEHLSNLKQRLGVASVTNGVGPNANLDATALPSQSAPIGEPSSASLRPISPQFQPPQPVTSLSGIVSSARDTKTTAAALAAKLQASLSPAQVLSSVLSSLVAEEAAAKNSGSPSGASPAGPPGFPVDKRPRLEKPMPISDGGAPGFFAQVQPVQPQMGLPQTSVAGMQSLSQANQAPLQFLPPPPLPPMPPQPLMQQFGQNNGMAGIVPFPMMGGTLQPQPPPPNPFQVGQRPSAPPPPPPSTAQNQQQQQHQQQQQQQSRPPTSAGYFQAPGMGFFPPVQTAPSVQRQ